MTKKLGKDGPSPIKRGTRCPECGYALLWPRHGERCGYWPEGVPRPDGQPDGLEDEPGEPD